MLKIKKITQSKAAVKDLFFIKYSRRFMILCVLLLQQA